ncbi:MAG: segregation/condensation protein A [Mollicutes bacterium]|nr:segregation/condensation protein A [Mollicutes bacterium]
MDIYEINIVEITDQYMQFIYEMEELNIDVASEYLVMASELLNLKSRHLLNQDDEEENAEGIVSVEDLQNKIIEYEKYKNITTDFKELEEKRSEVYTKMPSILTNYFEPEMQINTELSVNDLINAFSLFLDRQKLSKPLNTKIVKSGYNVEERCRSIKSILKEKKKINFVELFDIITKEYIVVTFLSILELAKNAEIVLNQDKNFGTIMIEMK